VLTYCSNIHPGESWQDVRRNLEAHLLGVKKQFRPDAPFPMGLRISAAAAHEIDDDEAQRFAAWCDEEALFVPTINGFPHGVFYGAGVKEKVYLPDWRDPARVAYTNRLADLLAGWLPDGVRGSISTVPVAFKPHFDERDWDEVRRNVVTTLEHLARIRDDLGREIVLSFEPEPRCVLETSAETVAFFDRMALPDAIFDLAGVCLDCCHQAIEFEEPAACLDTLSRAGIRLGKVQVSSALRVSAEELDAVARFDEPVYLHQVIARWRDGSLTRHDDLPQFFDSFDPSRREALDECRVHFHVPIFAERMAECSTTQPFLREILPLLDPDVLLEVETYSWNVLPEELRAADVADEIVRELSWVEDCLAEARREV
jgi:hypothetical protein